MGQELDKFLLEVDQTEIFIFVSKISKSCNSSLLLFLILTVIKEIVWSSSGVSVAVGGQHRGWHAGTVCVSAACRAQTADNCTQYLLT